MLVEPAGQEAQFCWWWWWWWFDRGAVGQRGGSALGGVSIRYRVRRREHARCPTRPPIAANTHRKSQTHAKERLTGP